MRPKCQIVLIGSGGKINMLHGNSLVKFVTVCNKNKQSPMFQGMTQRILLIPVRNLCLEGHQYQQAVQWLGWQGSYRKLELLERLKGAYQGRFCILLVAYSALSAFLSFLQHSVQILSTSWRPVCTQLLICSNSYVILYVILFYPI